MLDREIAQAGSDCSTPLLDRPTLTEQEVHSLLVKVSGKLVSLKRKVEEVVTEEVECVQVCKTRLDHIKAYASGKLRTCNLRAYNLSLVYPMSKLKHTVCSILIRL